MSSSAAPAPKPKYRDELQRWAKGSPLTEVQEALASAMPRVCSLSESRELACVFEE